jgi:hypothetical protein
VEKEIITNRCYLTEERAHRKGKREYLNDKKTREMMRKLQGYFEEKIEIPLIRHGKQQRLRAR